MGRKSWDAWETVNPQTVVSDVFFSVTPASFFPTSDQPPTQTLTHWPVFNVGLETWTSFLPSFICWEFGSVPLPHNWTLTEKTGDSCSSRGPVISQCWERKAIDGRKVKCIDVHRAARTTREAKDQGSKETTDLALCWGNSVHTLVLQPTSFPACLSSSLTSMWCPLSLCLFQNPCHEIYPFGLGNKSALEGHC